ncbi:hypothetical protein RN001_007157 [Aquatica leii]|uniref:VWFA domain-containing protein n=1 Tax=Aquatica leii TaxID=1421715 RepID=A0AAN7PBA1_9COLE|nr:hypothetical protein RN001_007157 [Aquatica leii]
MDEIVDYTRHLEEISKQVESILLEIIQNQLLNGEYNKGLGVLKMWEKCSRHLRTVRKSETMAAETEFFKSKLHEISNLLDYLKSIEATSEAEICEVENNIRTLLSQVSSEESLNAGGRFEWIDSLLIRCLQEGSWLLIDNVNLCSPAVLDRLNGLLEPKGVLKIGERGVKEDGKMFKVKPHKDFRLFLTMDPKNGEISRAMRNRGVEIYLFGENEEGFISNDLDLKSLINHKGLTDASHIDAVLKMHYFVSDMIIGEKPNTNHLLQAAFLTAQQLLRGVNIHTALYNSIVDVYYEKQSEFNSVDILLTIKEKIDAVMGTETGYYHNSMTLTSSDLSTNSRLANVKQQTILLPNLSNELFCNAFINSFTVTSSKNLKMRHAYLKHFLSTHKKEFLELNDQFLEICKRFDGGELPFDSRWITLSNESSNNLYLNLYYSMKLFYLKMRFNTGKKMTLFSFLKGVSSKKVEGKIDDVLEKEFLNVLDTFDDFFYAVIKNKLISDVSTIDVVSLLQWRYLLYEFTTVNIQEMDLEEYKKLIDKLHIHYRWFIKHLIKKFSQLLNIEVPRNLVVIINNIDENTTRDFSVLQKISKMFQKCISKPPPFHNDKQMLAYEEYKTIVNDFDLNAQNDYLKLISFLHNHKELRCCLIEARSKLNESELGTQLKDLHSEYLHGDDVGAGCHLEMLPILDYFACLTLNALKCNFDVVNRDILTQVLTVPSSLVGTFDYFSATGNQCLKHELKSILHWYLLNAVSITPSKLTSNAEGCVDRSSMARFTPVLSSLVTDLLMAHEKSKENLRSTSFGDYREIMKQRRKLNLMLWRNLLQLSCSDYDYVKCETKYINTAYEEFLSQLATVFNTTESDLKELSRLCVGNINDLYRKSEMQDKNKDCNLIVDLLKRCGEEVEKLSNVNKDESIFLTLIIVSNAHFLLSYLKILLTSKLPLIDPLVKTQLKKDYCQKESEEFSNIVQSYELQNNIYSCSLETLHPYVPLMKEKLKNLGDKNLELCEYVAVRPQKPNYSAMYKEVTHYLEMVLMPQRINKLFEDLNNFCVMLQTGISDKATMSTVNFEKLVQETQQQCFNFSSFINILNKYRYNYPDIIGPLLSNVTEFLYALVLKKNLSKALMMEYNNMRVEVDLNKDLVNIVRFPVLNKEQSNYLNAVALYTKPRIQNFVNNVNVENSKAINFGLLKCGVQELYNISALNVRYYKILDKKVFGAFDELLKVVVRSWKEQEEERERRQKELESLYKFPSKSEEDEIEEDFNRLFPSSRDKDFADLEPQELGDDSESLNNQPTSYIGVITLDDVKFVSQTHSEFLRVHTQSEWLRAEGVHRSVDFILPLLSKFKLYQVLIKKFGECLNYKVDSQIISSLNILTYVAENFGDTKSLGNRSPTTSYNFYKDANIDEVKNSYHILEELRLHIGELLKEWPDHPSLKWINVVIDRIFSFDIASPLSRFLTGFEILLAKCHEWEENAHTGVSLQEYIQNLVRQIILWRQIEMNIWKDSLNVAFERANEPVSKWWFYIYSVVSQFIEEDKIAVGTLVETLKTFIEQSNLGEFSNRLQLLLTFHYHVVQLERTKNTDVLCAILWNLHKYYKQYESNVIAKIKELRTPIEKKLKDYVKIVRWKDISYWAIKQTAERTHKTLHKHIREFEVTLKQPVVQCLTQKGSETKEVGVWDNTEPNKRSTCDVTYIIKDAKWNFDVAEEEETIEIFKHSKKYFNKSCRLCENILTKTNYSESIENLNEFVTDVIESSIRLQNLEVNTTLTKDKQKSQAKAILQQKRKALADLFKALAEIGLSYRTGIIQFRTSNECDRFLIKPIDLNAGFSHLNKENCNDDNLLSIWKDCESYYYRAQAKFDALKINLRSPAQDLGLQNVDRCKGFSQNLMQMIYGHKFLLVNTSRVFYYLRVYSQSLAVFNDCTTTRVPSEMHEKIVNLLQKILVTLEQYKIILSTTPEEINIEDDVPILKSFHNFIQYKNDDTWRYCSGKIDSTLSSTQQLLVTLASNSNYVPSVEFKCAKPVLVSIPLQDILNNFNSILESLQNFNEAFNNIPTISSVQWLVVEITQLKESLLQHPNSHVESLNLSNVKRNAQKLVKKILIILQNMYHKYNKVLEDDEKNLLKTSILNNLLTDSNVLDMTAVLKHLHNTVKYAHKLNPFEVLKCRNIFLQIRPILNQLILFYEYFLTQQISAYRSICKMSFVLSNVFVELTAKGFCVPPEFSEELNEGMNQASNGMGLGDGEGERDVSDRIESEDQLEDAEPAGKEKQEQDDKDCKEEEKGIEMSEDFDSKLQDIEKDEDDVDEKSDNEDADEQMGDTDKNADRLDQEIWGSDEEIENFDEDQKEEKGEKGEKQGEDELAAKENESSNANDDKEGKHSQEKEKEINKMDDPEYDDNQIDPYHGNPPQYPEPEAMDLPENMEVDDDMQENDENPNEENPFDIDTMKEQQPPLEPEPEVEPEQNENDEQISESSDVENTNKDKDEDTTNNCEDQTTDDVKKPEENSDENLKNEKDNQQSALDETQTQDESQAMDADNIDASDNVKMNKSENQKNNQNNEICQEDKPDKEGVGQSRMEESKSGHAGQAAAQEDVTSNRLDEDELQTNRRPGETDSKRSLGNVNESVKKKLKTIEAQYEDDAEDTRENTEDTSAEMYQHIKDAQKSDNQVLDAATEEQVSEQKELPDLQTEKEDSLKMHEDPEEIDVSEAVKQKAEKVESELKKKSDRQHHEGNALEDLNNMEVEGDIIETTTVPRGTDTTYHTRYDAIDHKEFSHLPLSQINEIRNEVHQQLSSWSEPPTTIEAQQTWRKILSVTSGLAQGLSEQLRLVLEPTQASRLKGDYRTGRRINMRKIIPYIASQFRKDKIWLRRTKPSKREYKIVLAIDDSSSMSDNRSKELTFESVALISKALTLLESGQLSVLSFGETTDVLHKLSDPFTERSGSNILQKFQFSQKKTCVSKLVDFATEMLNTTQSNTTASIAKLLIIVSDGRGIFSEGEVYVQQAVRRAKLSNVFMVFVIVDNPESKDSILDIRTPMFKDGKLLGIKPYMDSFPFPFYIILRNINSLPNVLSDALRQWFEIVSNVDK